MVKAREVLYIGFSMVVYMFFILNIALPWTKLTRLLGLFLLSLLEAVALGISFPKVEV